MAAPALKPAQTAEENTLRAPAGTDLVEWYFEQGWTDGLPVVPPTRARVDAVVDALGGDPGILECKVPPRHGSSCVVSARYQEGTGQRVTAPEKSSVATRRAASPTAMVSEASISSTYPEKSVQLCGNALCGIPKSAANSRVSP